MTGPDPRAAAHIYVDALDDRCDISGSDGHHLTRVRRLRVGELVTAADGAGAWRPYEIVECAAGRVVVEARGEPQVEATRVPAIALAVALTKGGLDDVVAATTELGVARVTPVVMARSVARWDVAKAANATQRLRAIAREAGMQSRRAWLPVVDDVVDFEQIAARSDLVVTDAAGVRAADLAQPRGGMWTVLVGPEGGLAPEEQRRVVDAPRLSLGPHILRAATAPVAAVAVLMGLPA